MLRHTPWVGIAEGDAFMALYRLMYGSEWLCWGLAASCQCKCLFEVMALATSQNSLCTYEINKDLRNPCGASSTQPESNLFPSLRNTKSKERVGLGFSFVVQKASTTLQACDL